MVRNIHTWERNYGSVMENLNIKMDHVLAQERV